jgi:hypothetical protein
MIGRWGLYGDLIREFRAAGISPEDAAAAASIAERITRERRDLTIRAARAIGWPYRRIAEFWGLDVARVHKIVALTDAVAGQRSSVAASLPRQAGECRGASKQPRQGGAGAPRRGQGEEGS